MAAYLDSPVVGSLLRRWLRKGALEDVVDSEEDKNVANIQASSVPGLSP